MIDLYDEMISRAREYTWPGPHKTILDVKTANARAGQSWFSPATLRLWHCRVSDNLYGGRVFVSSEQNDIGGYSLPRVYTVRIAGDDGTVDTLGELGQFASRATAKRWAQKVVAEMMGESNAQS